MQPGFQKTARRFEVDRDRKRGASAYQRGWASVSNACTQDTTRHRRARRAAAPTPCTCLPCDASGATRLRPRKCTRPIGAARAEGARAHADHELLDVLAHARIVVHREDRLAIIPDAE
eukprot:6187274-Pleurochrysis_carterae.AAC.3